MTTPEINTKEGLVRHMQRNGSHFFDPDTMRFFNSRLEDQITQKGVLVYFITSEQFVHQGCHHPRKYSIRVVNLNSPHCSTSYIGEFQQYQTANAARKALKAYIVKREKT